MAVKVSSWLPVLTLLLILYARPTHAFGAGNVSRQLYPHVNN